MSSATESNVVSFFACASRCAPHTFPTEHKPVTSIHAFVANLNARFHCDELRLSELEWTLQPEHVNDADGYSLRSGNRYREHLTIATGAWVDRVTYNPHLATRNYFVAGGAALNALHEQVDEKATRESDLDFWVVAETDQLQRIAARRLLKHFESLRPQGEVYFAKKHNVTYVWIKGMHCPIQVIMLPGCRTVADVIENFDQSCCAWAWDGQQVWCTSDAVHAMRTSTNVANVDKYNRLAHYNPDKCMETLARRMRKMETKGFVTTPPDPQFDFRNKLIYPDAGPNPCFTSEGRYVFPAFGALPYKANAQRLVGAYGVQHVTLLATWIPLTRFVVTPHGAPVIISYHTSGEDGKRHAAYRSVISSTPAAEQPSTGAATQQSTNPMDTTGTMQDDAQNGSWLAWLATPITAAMKGLNLY